MRIKFEKGITPEIMANEFLNLIREHGKLVGSVNMYVCFYGEDMKLDKDNITITCSATDAESNYYAQYEADKRRKGLRAV